MRRASFLVPAAVLAAPSLAFANGRYPAASQLLVDPTNPQHIVVSATFGLLDSRDGGKTFGWLCEAAIGTSGQQDLMLALAGNGATVVAMFNGIATTMDGCAYRAVPELADKTMGDVAGSKSTPHELAAFWYEFKPGGTFASQLVRSQDDGQTWSPIADVLPPDVYPLTVDIAPSRASRIYVSARGDKTKNFGSMLMRSDDGGVTFTSVDIPDTEEHRLTYIAAVHPSDPDRLYLRVMDATATVVLMSSDAGRTFQKIFTGTGQLLGFAMAPDGSQIAVGGPDDGIWVGPSDGASFARVSDVGANCLTWTPGALFVCADYKMEGFSIGQSKDSGKSFQGLFRFDALCGRAACGNDNTARCTEEWDLIAPAIGATCGADAGWRDASGGGMGLDAGATGGSGGAATGGTGGTTGGTPGTAGTSGTGGAPGTGGSAGDASSDDSGGCSIGRVRDSSTSGARTRAVSGTAVAEWGALVGFLAALLRWRRSDRWRGRTFGASSPLQASTQTGSGATRGTGASGGTARGRER